MHYLWASALARKRLPQCPVVVLVFNKVNILVLLTKKELQLVCLCQVFFLFVILFYYDNKFQGQGRVTQNVWFKTIDL